MDDTATLTPVPEAGEPEETQLFSHPKYFACFFGDNRTRLVPVKRNTVTGKVLGDVGIELGTVMLKDVKMLVHIVSDPVTVEKLVPYMRTEV